MARVSEGRAGARAHAPASLGKEDRICGPQVRSASLEGSSNVLLYVEGRVNNVDMAVLMRSVVVAKGLNRAHKVLEKGT